MKKILPLFAGITLLAGVSAANAGEPMSLTTAQMDNVVAGATVCTNGSCRQANIALVLSVARAGNNVGAGTVGAGAFAGANTALSLPILGQSNAINVIAAN